MTDTAPSATPISDPSPLDLETVRSLRDALLAIRGDGPDAGLAMWDLHGRAKALAARCRDLVRLIEDSALEHIDATGSDIELPDGTRWYAAPAKTVKARDDLAVLHAIMHAVGGDLDRITTGDNGVLASNPWKQGTVKGLIGAEEFERLFVTKYEKDLKTGAQVRKIAQTRPLP